MFLTKRKLAALATFGIMVFSLSESAVAKDIPIDFAGSGTVRVARAKVAEKSSGQSLRISGNLHRFHKIPLAGHLHVYLFSGEGQMVAESKHPVIGLTSMRKGKVRVPFIILIEEVPPGINRVFLKYHIPGHPEA